MTEPFPELPDWEWADDAERDAEEDTRVQEPAAAVPPQEPEEDELPDYEYYEQLDQEMEAEAEAFIQQDTQPSDVELYRAIAAINHTLFPSSSADISVSP